MCMSLDRLRKLGVPVENPPRHTAYQEYANSTQKCLASWAIVYFHFPKLKTS